MGAVLVPSAVSGTVLLARHRPGWRHLPGMSDLIQQLEETSSSLLQRYGSSWSSFLWHVTVITPFAVACKNKLLLWIFPRKINSDLKVI